MDDHSSSDHDVEKIGDLTSVLANTSISSFSWSDISVSVADKATGHDKRILQDISGICRPGEVLALMGPSGSGKTTLLNELAHRSAGATRDVKGEILINGCKSSAAVMRQVSSFVEQDDHLIGAMTVRETVDFAAQLGLDSGIARTERLQLVDSILASFGLSDCAGSLIGTPIRKGISGGQKRRTSVASQLITSPNILFLDEVTSGLDSAASQEVMSFIRDTARKLNLIVIASIHQPSTSTFNLFDKVIFLSQGKTAYYGPVADLENYFGALAHPIPAYCNPAEYILDLINVDFGVDRAAKQGQLDDIVTHWNKGENAKLLTAELLSLRGADGCDYSESRRRSGMKSSAVVILLHRAFIKSYRDVIVYGVRLAMYLGLAILMGTVWLRLGSQQEDIQLYINAIFFGAAFTSFMAVAYTPAFLEDRSMFIKERNNGLYGPTSFLVANFITGLIPLFAISLLFSVITYWLSGFYASGTAFMTWVMWLFLDLVAAESLVVLVATCFPNFVISLALVAFANGLWMCVGGFLVSPTVLNVFWKYVFSFIDYQRWAFQGLMVNELSRRVYQCDADCNCMYQSSLAAQCEIDGNAVLDSYGYATGKQGEWVGIMVGIIVGYRLLAWLATWLRKT